MKAEIKGNLALPAEWTVIAPFDGRAAPLPDRDLAVIPEALTVGGKTARAEKVVPTRGQYDFRPFFGAPPYKRRSSSTL